MKPKKGPQQTIIIVSLIVLLFGAMVVLNMLNNEGTSRQIPAGHSADDGHNH